MSSFTIRFRMCIVNERLLWMISIEVFPSFLKLGIADFSASQAAALNHLCARHDCWCVKNSSMPQTDCRFSRKKNVSEKCYIHLKFIALVGRVVSGSFLLPVKLPDSISRTLECESYEKMKFELTWQDVPNGAVTARIDSIPFIPEDSPPMVENTKAWYDMMNNIS